MFMGIILLAVLIGLILFVQLQKFRAVIEGLAVLARIFARLRAGAKRGKNKRTDDRILHGLVD